MAATADDDDYEVIYAVFRTNTITVSHELFTVPLLVIVYCCSGVCYVL